jgi:molecular chaperone DnaK (HSP70)
MISIGIDLGTTNSVAAVVEGGNVRKPRVLLSRTRETFTPSVVGSGPRGGLFVGREAWNNAEAAPADTVISVKRLMGRGYDDPEVKTVSSSYSYNVTFAADPTDPGVYVLIAGQKYSPVQLSSLILRQIVEDASNELGQQVNYAVITVPAYFSEPQRAATRMAGEQAGVIVKKIIDEPTAAAIAFGVDRADEKHRILVFDMGGGTLDVSILVAANGEFTVKAVAGNMWLGGDDLDEAIVNIIVDWIKRTYQVDPSGDPRFRLIVRRYAEGRKRLLSEQDEVDVFIPACFSLRGGGAGDVRMTLTRKVFEERINPFVDQGIGLVDSALAKAGLTANRITTVLLVGGSTYVPMVRRALAEKFGEDKIRSHVNPMDAVALGAAVLAEQLRGIACPSCGTTNVYEAKNCLQCQASLSAARDVGGHLHEVTERTFGICMRDQDDPDVFEPIIREGTPYPLKEPIGTRAWAVNRQVTVPVYAGNDPKASHNEYLGLVQETLPPDVPPRTPVKVYFNYDRHRILTVRIEVEGREDLILEAIPKRQTTDPHRDETRDQWQVGLQNVVAFAEHMVERYGEFIPGDQRQALDEALHAARQAQHDGSPAAGQEALDKLMQILDSLELASRLQVVDHLITRVDQESLGWLIEQTKQLKDAFRANNMVTVKRLRQDLDAKILKLMESLPAAESASFRGLLEKWK